MRVASIQVGRIRACDRPLGPERTAIDKRVVEGPIRAGRLGLQGDEVADLRHHGGPERAVLFASRATYPVFEARLGRALPSGSFGENLTVEGLTDADVSIGDRLCIGDAEFEVASPRIPCGTLARHLEDPGVVAAIGEPHRAGWYARVVREGLVRAGDRIERVARPHPEWSIARVAAAKKAALSPEEATALATLTGLGSDWVARFRDRAAAGA